jgi:hypothetical protein
VVAVTPYARHRFDGLRVDTPEEAIRHTADGASYKTSTIILGGAPVKLPVPPPCCSELATLIQQIETLPAPDGFRRIVHLLVDAGAQGFETVDPDLKDIFRTPPAVRFHVDNAKFQGEVTVLYERGLDLYAVELRRNGEVVERVDEVYFDTLGDALERLIDDGNWRRIRVEALTGKATSAQSA